MSATLDPESWVRFLDSDYLATFLADGGSAVKFVVPIDEAPDRSIALLREAAHARGFACADVHSDETRIHMADRLLFQINDQIDWREVTERVLRRFLTDLSYAVPDAVDGSFIDSVAMTSGVDRGVLLMEMRKKVAADVFRQELLSKDFRVAMTQMCIAVLVGSEDSITTFETVRRWLVGELATVGEIKPYQIFTKINRSNARHNFESLLHWLRFAGFPGLVVLIDIRRIGEPRNPKDGTVYYTKAAVLDAYEVLRQFIDGTDRMEGCLITAFGDQGFLDEEPGSRGMGAYQALKFRIFDEVRDRFVANPLASLVRVSTSPGPGA